MSASLRLALLTAGVPAGGVYNSHCTRQMYCANVQTPASAPACSFGKHRNWKMLNPYSILIRLRKKETGLMVGTTLGHYRIIRQLGVGGMGEVYLAEDPRLDRTVAIKILRPEFVSDPSRLKRFILEAKAASAISHSHVAHIYEIGEEEGIHFIAMEFVDGITLGEKMQSEQLSVSAIINFAVQIADALDAAYSKGIIHRDIKPANIMVTRRNDIKVLDFGLAKLLNREPDPSTGDSSKGLIFGTLYFLSPEQALGRPVDHRSDIFSFGVTLYQLATMRVPFQAETTIETLQLILHEPPQAITDLNHNIPAELERIILKCLEKDPDRRYQSAGDLFIDLKKLKRDTESGKITAPLVLEPRKRRLKWIVPLLLLIVAVAAIRISLKPKDTETIRSIAVLPFVNVSSDQQVDYLSDGITDHLINQLSRIPGLTVMARGTVFSYKQKEIDPRKIGRELNVDGIVTGKLLQQGQDLKVQVSLEKADGTHVWGEEYAGKIPGIFDIQDAILREIAGSLQPKMKGPVKSEIRKEHTKNVEAYQLYLKGRYYLEKRTRDDFQRAIRSFQEATALDPNYALAYAGLADAYTLLSNWGFLPAANAFLKARDAAQKALSLDPSLAEAYTSLAVIKYAYDRDWAGAENDFRQAILLNPNYSTAHHWFSFFLSLQGRQEEALKEIRIAGQLDPLSMIINANKGLTLYLARRYDEALHQLQKTLDLDPNFPLAYQYLGYVYEQQKEYDRSISSYLKAIDLAPDNLSYEADVTRANALSGAKQEAERRLDQLLRLSFQVYVSPVDIASVYVALHQNDRALEWLEKACDEHSDQSTYVGVDPRFDALRTDPRFQRLLSRLGLKK